MQLVDTLVFISLSKFFFLTDTLWHTVSSAINNGVENCLYFSLTLVSKIGQTILLKFFKISLTAPVVAGG